MFIINHRRIFFLISGLLVLGSYVALGYYGLTLGTDFTGGTIVEVDYSAPTNSVRPALAELKTNLDKLDLGQIAVQEAGDRGFLLRLRTITEEEHQLLKQALGGVEKRYSSIGPAVGDELAQKGLIAIAVVVILIVLYIAFVFRHVSRPVSSWKYGLIAILALIHDISIPTGVMALLGHFYGVEADALFLTALLTILGLSVNDTIVVFDRIREHLRHRGGERFEEVVGQSLNETISRSINTSLTVILALLAVYFFGGTTTKYFALVMAIGMFFGTYSSIFIASPLLVSWQKWSGKER
ncbi:MAG: protein translocase subunit SecF [Patescibacteria group bacterium]